MTVDDLPSDDPVIALLLARAQQAADIAAEDAERLLLADAIACAAAGARKYPRLDLAGRTEVASQLGLWMSVDDRDDIAWRTLVHPGSVVWPVVIGLADIRWHRAETIRRAARMGYQLVADLSECLGQEHRRWWHVTGTAGAAGSALVAAEMLGLDPERQRCAVRHAVSASGGLGQALVEHSGSGAFHRAAAISHGILAAAAARSGIGASREPVSGRRGLMALMKGCHMQPSSEIGSLAESSLRMYPINGFSQGAVEATAALRGCRDGTVDAIDVWLSPQATAATGAENEPWWRMSYAVARAWETGDPFAGSPKQVLSLERRVRISADPALNGCAARVRIDSETGWLQRSCPSPVGTNLEDPSAWSTAAQKWQRMGQSEKVDPVELADRLLRRADSGPILSLVCAE